LAEIVLERVSKVFGAGVRAVDDVSLEIAAGEFLVLVGPSGCGKSTLLRVIAGLEEATDGQIRIGDEDVTDKAPRERDVAMVFQSYALYPHMTVRQNLGYGLKVRRTKKSEAAERVAKVARLLRLDDLLDRRPAELSGGQRQRVAMGRAIVREPKAFLMDEPLSNLDAKLRVGMRAELVSLHDRLGATTVYVTHDQVEAMTLGQRVAVMRDGRIQQVDTPQVLYRLPQTLFVAAFIGSPAMNLVEAVVEGGAVEFGGFRIPLPPLLGDTLPGGPVVLGIRPESFEDVAFADPSLPQMDVTVQVLEELGSDTHVIFPIDAPRVETDELRETREGEDELLLAGDKAVFNARVDARTAASPGSPLRLAVDPARFHFFDRETGENIGLRQEPSRHLGAERGDTREPLLDDRLPGRVGTRIPRDGG
jgi:multiple sugar transport system ATP-binding protein